MPKGCLVITVSGLAGSGTTTLCRNLARHYGFKHIYAGLIFRQMAREMGMSLQEFQKYAELHPRSTGRWTGGRSRQPRSATSLLRVASPAGWLRMPT